MPYEVIHDTLSVNRAPLVYLSGSVTARTLDHPQLGIMFQPGMGNRPRLGGTPWALDNGCFALGDRFDGDAFRRFLAQDYWHEHRATCRFVVAPDVLGDAPATLARAAWWLPRLREAGPWPRALVGQDGLDYHVVPWSDFEVLFIGGSTAWKLGPDAHYLAVEARTRGKQVHMGRVNSLRRMTHAARIGCHTYDGTYLAFGPDVNGPRLAAWARRLAYARRPAR